MNRKKHWVLPGILILGAAGYGIFGLSYKNGLQHAEEFTSAYGSIQNTVEAVGTVKPRERFGVRSHVSGRVDKILVKEGQHVKEGDILAVMSSSERATLLSAARSQGPEVLKQWEDVYLPFPLLAPIEGDVIVKSVHVGQVVSPSEDVVVISDRLIVKVRVDETDIAKVKVGQEVNITAEAYPDVVAKGEVEHIYFESKDVNNLTIYEVDIVVDQLPEVFRAGMSATVEIILQKKDHALLVPESAVQNKNGKSFVMVKSGGVNHYSVREVQTGISDNINVEILSGLSAGEKVYVLPQNTPSAKPAPSTPWPFTS